MPKYLLLSVVCASISGLQAKELVDLKVEDSVVTKVQEPVVKDVAVPEPMVQEQDVDFAEFAKGLDMSDEERAQFIAAMSDDMDKEAMQSTDDSKNPEEKFVGKDKPLVVNAQEKVASEAKAASVEVELPEVTK